MNRPLRKVAMACLALFGLLMVNANWVQVVKAESYRDNPSNSRVLLRTYERERGAITVVRADGSGRTTIAESTRVDGPLEWLRRYPGGPAYAHVTGYYSLVYGRTGLERARDRLLSGEDDQLFARRLSDYVTGREPQGGNIITTLDPAAQEAAFDALGSNRGAVVALDPKTGAVLAMVSKPSFDPGRLSSFEPADIRAYYQQLNEAAADPLLNRAISKTYPPGSTFKVITSAAALANGVSPTTQIPSPKELDLPKTNARLRNFGGGSCTGETSNLADALMVSCNTAFGSLGLTLGDDKIREQAEKFGFGRDDLDVPTGVATSVFPEDPDEPSTAFSAIGQFDVRVTPLQMAMVAAGIANGGEVMAPYLVREVQAPDLSRLDVADPDVYERAVSGDIAAELTRMMELVVSGPLGSGKRAQIPGVRVAGKTGTAQHAQGKPPHAWFIGFAPADDPKVAVAVVVEDGGSLGSEATGGQLSAPIAKRVMEAVLRR